MGQAFIRSIITWLPISFLVAAGSAVLLLYLFRKHAMRMTWLSVVVSVIVGIIIGSAALAKGNKTWYGFIMRNIFEIQNDALGHSTKHGMSKGLLLASHDTH